MIHIEEILYFFLMSFNPLQFNSKVRPHVYIVDAQLAPCTDVVSQRCTSTDPDLSSSRSSHVADLVDLNSLVAEHGYPEPGDVIHW